jgi:hypothetical protein
MTRFIEDSLRLTVNTRKSAVDRPAKRSFLGFTVSLAEVLSPLRELDKWIRRPHLATERCYQWKQWGRAGYRQLRRRGVTVREAWNTSKSAHGLWRISRTPALTLALPRRTFLAMGLPELAA